ncbi:transketolase [Halosquirtibacter xylanolyticus]|uniref:transketolase family protein n=1 Tax=Halosquirtibacter xylanolyticus TaxID=3374599 RepID=UPI0037484071|nr:transketolase [Prolixibacteraceae bacterium]
MNNKVVDKAADNIRILSAAMVEKAKSGHPGGAMGGADFINILYSEFLRYDPDNKLYPHRDRFFLDPGHMSPMLYSTLALAGNYSMEELANFRQWGTVTPGHPEVDFARGVENTSGPLGQGHTMAVGAAIAERFLVARFGEWMSHKTYAFISDGGVQEEISQGSGRIAGTLGLSNLIMFYDSNDIQLSTTTDAVTSENTAMKYESWGWKTITIDGNDADAIRQALIDANNETSRPTLIIGKTVMGKGALSAEGESFERKVSTHGQPLSAAGASMENTIKNLGGNPENPFQVFDDVKALYAERAEALRSWMKGQKGIETEWTAANPELADKLVKFFSKDAIDFDFDKIEQKANSATRNASATVLQYFASEIDNMIVASADLSNSDKTDGFLKGGSYPFKKGDFTGSFFNAGVCELTMACIMNGMALHGGIIPVCGTFFVFSDYMKPAIRMAALMELPVKYVWSHDAFRVGEDGPTHQPVEQEAQIRLMEHLKNHKGENSMLVLRPADAQETTVAWRLALENTSTPTGMIFSRQNVQDLPTEDSRYEDAKAAAQGAYIVEDDENAEIILLASGSEVSTLVEGAQKLRADGIAVRIVSAPSEGLFRSQSAEYQEEVLPTALPKFGLTAGLPVTLQGLVGNNGCVWGLSSFGFSAPYTVLDQELGFNGENVYNQVKTFLGK